MSKALIEDYRGFEIMFDTVREKFYAVVEDSRDWQSKDKQSYASAKKAVDDYIKRNATFKPFKVMNRPSFGGRMFGSNSTNLIEIVGIRKDKDFISSDKKRINLTSKYAHDELILWKPEYDEILNQLTAIVKKSKDFENECRKEYEELMTTLNLETTHAFARELINKLLPE
jgi:hypothetical protein